MVLHIKSDLCNLCLCPNSVLLCPVTFKWRGGKRDIYIFLMSVCIKPVFRYQDPSLLVSNVFNLPWFIFAKIQYVTLQVKYG